jgi:hypothetical protein
MEIKKSTSRPKPYLSTRFPTQPEHHRDFQHSRSTTGAAGLSPPLSVTIVKEHRPATCAADEAGEQAHRHQRRHDRQRPRNPSSSPEPTGGDYCLAAVTDGELASAYMARAAGQLHDAGRGRRWRCMCAGAGAWLRVRCASTGRRLLRIAMVDSLGLSKQVI